MKSKKSTVDTIAENLAAEREKHAGFLLEIERLADARPGLIRVGDQAAIDKNDDERQTAQRSADRSAERIAILEQDFAAASVDAAQREREKREHDADLAGTNAANALNSFFRDVKPRVRAIMRTIAEADRLIAEANKRRPADAEPLLTTEARVRIRRAMPIKVLSERTVDRWVYDETGHRLSDELADRVVSQDGVSGRLPPTGKMSTNYSHVTKRKFTERVFLPASRALAPPSLIKDLHIPALRAGDAPIWAPPPDSNVTGWLDLLEEADARGDEREPVTELVPIE